MAVNLEHHSAPSAIALMERLGARFGTVIDAGCADGQFFVELKSIGLLRGASVFNVDAQAVYEPTLKRIKAAIGGDYRICALGAEPGELALGVGAHPYWSSPRPADDPYWDRVDGAKGAPIKVPMHRLDDLVRELDLKPPFLLKLDVQGAEVDVFRGAPETLARTEGVIVEADIDDFAAIHSALDAAGMALFDLAYFNRAPDQTLGWFYPVYVSRALAQRRARRLWDAKDTPAAVAMQDARRQRIKQALDQQLPRLELARRMGQF
ncbi:MAG: FkbM family methyltransferase [Alphaproteobacteria bacterium]|nr:FkbM family methyltransferase [Alphaproteobacteria bacterium]